MTARKTSIFLGISVLVLAASASISFAQSTWRNVDCSNSPITHPALTNCQEGPKSNSGNFDAWSSSGNIGAGRPAQVNLNRSLAVPVNYYGSLRDSQLEDALKSFYSQHKESAANSTLSTVGELKVLKFKATGSGRDCAIFHKWGNVVAYKSNAGFSHYVRGFLCAAENEELTDSNIQEFVGAIAVKGR